MGKLKYIDKRKRLLDLAYDKVLEESKIMSDILKADMISVSLEQDITTQNTRSRKKRTKKGGDD